MQKIEEDKPGILLSAVTHEIRNPLTLIQSYLQLIGTQYPEIRSSAYFCIVESELHHLNSLLNDFNLYQKEIHIKRELTPMTDWLKAYIKTILPIFREFPEMVFQTEICADLPVLQVDAGKIRQLLDNLIRNALEAIEQKRRICEEAAAAVEPGTEGTKEKDEKQKDSIMLSAYMKECFLCIDVTDTGCGIEPEQESSLFKPFVTGKEGGTGLGLPICRKIAQAHGGTVRLCGSSLGKTRFQVLLPAKSRR